MQLLFYSRLLTSSVRRVTICHFIVVCQKCNSFSTLLIWSNSVILFRAGSLAYCRSKERIFLFASLSKENIYVRGNDQLYWIIQCKDLQCHVIEKQKFRLNTEYFSLQQNRYNNIHCSYSITVAFTPTGYCLLFIQWSYVSKCPDPYVHIVVRIKLLWYSLRVLKQHGRPKRMVAWFLWVPPWLITFVCKL